MIKADIIDTTFFQTDLEGIYINTNSENITNKTIETWNGIYSFNLNKLIEMHRVFKRDKLADLLKYIDVNPYKNKRFVYLEIGCGPAFLGKYLLDNFDCIFTGVDLNYNALIELKKFLEYNNIPSDKYILVHADIRNMPIKNSTVDLIYGGGVIEHVPNTSQILSELYRVLNRNGTCVNTVPAFNFFWLTRFFMSIPNIYPLRNIFEYIHIKLLKEKILSKFYGYELSFNRSALERLYKSSNFDKIESSTFTFHPNLNLVKYQFLSSLIYRFTSSIYTSSFYCIKGVKL